MIAGAVVGSVVGVALLALAGFCLVRRRRRPRARSPSPSSASKPPETPPADSYAAPRLSADVRQPALAAPHVAGALPQHGAQTAPGPSDLSYVHAHDMDDVHPRMLPPTYKEAWTEPPSASADGAAAGPLEKSGVQARAPRGPGVA